MIKTVIALCIALVFSGCSPKPTEKEGFPNAFIHAWVMRGPMDGHMGVAIALTPDRYYYWFYSDVITGDEPSYPLSGTYTFDGTHLHLNSDTFLYSHDWTTITNRSGTPCLVANPEPGEDTSRLLVPQHAFIPKDPFGWPQLTEEQNKFLHRTR